MVYMIVVHFGLSNRIIEPAFPLVSQGIPQLNRRGDAREQARDGRELFRQLPIE
jgi:hypothetical protein